MKIQLLDSCKQCDFCQERFPGRIWCKKLDREVSLIVIQSDCPLPDWKEKT